MSAQPPRLTPKLRDLVATDRLGRPAVGRLTDAQADMLTAVALRRQEFDEPVSAPRAIAALAKGRPEAAAPVLEAVLTDPEAPRPDRVAAATGLGLIATPWAEALLLGAARDRDPRVQQAVLAALGWFGGPDVARELGKLQPAEAHARRQLELARALAVHRHGLEGPFLPEAPARQPPLSRRSTTTSLSLAAKTARATASDLGKVQGTIFGLDTAARGYALVCGRKEWTLFVHEALGGSFRAHRRLTERPWLAGVLCWWYPVRTIATAQYVVLTRPIDEQARVDVVRTDGEIVYTGTVEPREAATVFAVADVERAGTAPVRIEGRLTARGVELEVALAGLRRVGTPDTQTVSLRAP